jgi:hypothetical protein
LDKAAAEFLRRLFCSGLRWHARYADGRRMIPEAPCGLPAEGRFPASGFA